VIHDARLAERAADVALARTVRGRGKVVLVDLSAGRPSLRRQRHAGPPAQVRAVLCDSGLRVERVEIGHRSAVGLPMVRAFIASL
jgi:hypothetical protein